MAKNLTLPDGRSLSYTVTEGQGPPLLWIHGTPGSVTTQPGIGAACKAKNVRLINMSRAGYGDSTRKRGRNVVDAVADYRALLDHLGHEKCYVGGWSGGGPHALACAARLEGCIAAVVVGGVAPFEAEGLDWWAGQGEDNVKEGQLALEGEGPLSEYLSGERKDMLEATPESLVEIMSTLLPEVDKQTILQNDSMGEFMVTGIREALKHNADGMIDDSLAFVKPWGFEVGEAKCPVSIYHGGVDLMCPYDHGKWIASHLPDGLARRHLQDDQGHISIFIGQEEKILEELLGMK